MVPRKAILSGHQSQVFKGHPLCGLHAPIDHVKAMGVMRGLDGDVHNLDGAMGVAQWQSVPTGTSMLEKECKYCAH